MVNFVTWMGQLVVAFLIVVNLAAAFNLMSSATKYFKDRNEREAAEMRRRLVSSPYVKVENRDG